MCELQTMREVRKVMKYGVSRSTAREIVDVAFSVSSNDISKAIEYALVLKFGLTLPSKKS